MFLFLNYATLKLTNPRTYRFQNRKQNLIFFFGNLKIVILRISDRAHFKICDNFENV